MRTAFQKLLRSANPALPAATLPLVAKWDREGRLGGEIKTLVAQLTIRLVDATLTDEERAALVTSLLPAREMNSEILPAVGKLLGPPSSPALQRRVVDALGATPDPGVGPARQRRRRHLKGKGCCRSRPANRSESRSRTGGRLE